MSDQHSSQPQQPQQPQALPTPVGAVPQPPVPSQQPVSAPAPQQPVAAQPTVPLHPQADALHQPTVPLHPQQPASQQAQRPQQPYAAGMPQQRPVENVQNFKAESKGFLKRLFDLSFNESVTVSVAKVIYVIALVFIWGGAVVGVLSCFGAMFGALQFGGYYGYGSAGLLGFIGGLLMIPVVLLVALLINIAVRIWMEMAITLIRTAQNTRETVVLLQRAEERELRKQK